VVAQIGLEGEGQAAQVVHGFHVLRRHAMGIHALAMQGHVVIGVLQHLAQAIELQHGQGFAWHGLDLRVEKAARVGALEDPDFCLCCSAHGVSLVQIGVGD
jgi:hypothetical protein